MTYNLYIGSNNTTKQVELDKIQRVLDANLEGYTITDALGRWGGEDEDSVVVTVDCSRKRLEAIMAQLNNDLDQDAIGYQEFNSLGVSLLKEWR